MRAPGAADLNVTGRQDLCRSWEAIGNVPASAWRPAYDADGEVRDGARAADDAGLLDFSSWPAGMRVIVRWSQ